MSPYPFLTLDALTSLLSSILLPHPALPFLLSLCARAVGSAYAHPRFYVPLAWAAVLMFVAALKRVDAWVAFGPPRPVSMDGDGGEGEGEEEEVVVITGGAKTGGLGRVLAEVWGLRGVSVAVLDILDPDSGRDDSGKENGLARELEESGVAYYRCDVGDRAQVDAAKARIERDLGTPTVLINNAAVVNGKSILALTQDEIERTYRTNVMAHFNTIQAFLPGMLARRRGGTVVTVSSVLGELGCAGLSAYTSTKAAATALHHSLTAELQQMASSTSSNPSFHTSSTSPSASPPPRNSTKTTYPASIRTILIQPGALSTPLFAPLLAHPTLQSFARRFLAPPVETAHVAARIVALVDAGRAGEVREPLYARWVAALWLLPAGLRALCRRAAGLDCVGWEAFGASAGGGAAGGGAAAAAGESDEDVASAGVNAGAAAAGMGNGLAQGQWQGQGQGHAESARRRGRRKHE